MTAEAVIRFSLLSALSNSNEIPEQASRPFSKDRDGFVIAEGAAALVLENYDTARARGATILAVIRGAAEKADDFHRTRSKPDGSAVIGAIRNTIEDAGIELDDDQLHQRPWHQHAGKRQDGGDVAGCGLRRAHLKTIPISSNKSMIGHTLTAAGAHRGGLLGPDDPQRPDPADDQLQDPRSDDRARRRAQPRRATPRYPSVLSNSFGFGGQNACLIIAAEPA